MKAKYKINIKLTKEYYSEGFDQSIKYGSKWRKVEYFISFFFLSLGVYLYQYTQGETLLPLAFIAIAFFEFFSPYIKKIFWLKEFVKSKSYNTHAEMTFSDEGIFSKNEFSEGNILWQGIEKIVEGSRGFLIYPQKKIQIYLPKSLLSNEAAAFILSKQDELA